MAVLSLAPFPAEEYAEWLELEAARRTAGLWTPLTGDPSYGREHARRLVEESMPEGAVTASRPLLGAYDGSGRVGWVWLSRNEAGQLGVADAALDSDADPLSLLEVVEAHFRDLGMSHLLIDPVRGSEVLDAWAATGGYEDAATTMVLDLGTPIADPSVALRPASPRRFDQWRALALDAYADDIHRSTTMSHEAARLKADADYRRLLPDGLATDGNHLFDVVDRASGESAGFLWLADEHGGFVYDIVIDEARRGHGLGRATMNAAARWSRDRGLRTLGLTVWGGNTVARRLYDSLGYLPVQRHLKRRLAA